MTADDGEDEEGDNGDGENGGGRGDGNDEEQTHKHNKAYQIPHSSLFICCVAEATPQHTPLHH